MISKIVSILTVGVAAAFLAAPTNSYAVNAAQQKASVAALKAQLNALPLHKAPFAKVSSLVTQLATKDPKNASKYVALGFPKIAITNASANAKSLGSKVISIVNKSKVLSSSNKKSQAASINKQVTTYKAPGPNNPPYQAMVTTFDQVEA